MPRRAAQVNLTDTRRLIRAYQLEGVSIRATLQPGGSYVFEPVPGGGDQTKPQVETAEDLRGLL